MKETQIYRVCEQRAQSLLPNRLIGGSLGLFGTQSSYLGRFKWQLPASRKNLTVSNLGKDMDLSLLCTQYSARDELHHTALLLCHQDAPPRLEFLLTNRACSACKGWHPKSRLWLMAGPCCQSSLSKSPAVRWPQVYTHAHAVFTEVKQAACMLYLPKKNPHLGGMNPKEELWNHFLLLLLEKGEPGCLLFGHILWEGALTLSSRASTKVCARGHFCTVISGHTHCHLYQPLGWLTNCCGKRKKKKRFGHT